MGLCAAMALMSALSAWAMIGRGPRSVPASAVD